MNLVQDRFEMVIRYPLDAGVVNCDPVIVNATISEFLLTNQTKPQNYVYGELVHGGQLSFLIENLPKDGKGCPGRWMFAVMMQHFGIGVTAIQGNWTYGSNLATVNQLTASGAITLQDAAKQGPTGKYAPAWGFNQVQLMASTIGIPGNYTRVHVLFSR